MSNPLEFVKLRFTKETDRNFIINSFVKSYSASPEVKKLPKEIYFENQQKVAEDTYDTVQCLVATHSQDDEHILGYVLFENTEPTGVVIHFIFVKYPYRRFGIGNLLFKEATKDANSVQRTHTTYHSKNLADKYPTIYNPYLKIGVRL